MGDYLSTLEGKRSSLSLMLGDLIVVVKIGWDRLQKLALKVFMSGNESCESRSFLVLMVESYSNGKSRWVAATLGNKSLIERSLGDLTGKIEAIGNLISKDEKGPNM